MLKKTKKKRIPNPPSHPGGFRALLPLADAIVGELEPVPTDSVPLEEFSSVVEPDEWVGVAKVVAGIIGTVVEWLTRKVPEVEALVVVGSMELGLVRVVLEVAA